MQVFTPEQQLLLHIYFTRLEIQTLIERSENFQGIRFFKC